MSIHNICHSGGADGADRLWGNVARLLGHEVCHHSFVGHNSNDTDLVIHTRNELILADDFLKEAALRLKRKFPSKNEYVNNLLRRNFYQIINTNHVYAIADLDQYGNISGGTAWAIEMYKIRCSLYDALVVIDLYDKKTNCWYWADTEKENSWITYKNDMPPPPRGAWTGIGSREINDQVISSVSKLVK